MQSSAPPDDLALATDQERRSPDAALLDQVRRGDASAFSELYRRHRARALRTAVRWVGRQDAPDLVADAFARTLSALLRGHGPSQDLGPYLVTAMKAVRSDRFRHPTPTPISSDDPAWSRLLVADQVVEEPVLDEDLVRRALAELSPRHRLVLWLHIFEGLSAGQIGLRLGVSSNSASALLYRARRRLLD